MNTDRDHEILGLIERLSQEIELARELSLTQTAHILLVAQLDLKTVAYGISDDELREFTALVADDCGASEP